MASMSKFLLAPLFCRANNNKLPSLVKLKPGDILSIKALSPSEIAPTKLCKPCNTNWPPITFIASDCATFSFIVASKPNLFKILVVSKLNSANAPVVFGSTSLRRNSKVSRLFKSV